MAIFSAVSPLVLRVLTIVGRLERYSVALLPSRSRTAFMNGSTSDTYCAAAGTVIVSAASAIKPNRFIFLALLSRLLECVPIAKHV